MPESLPPDSRLSGAVHSGFELKGRVAIRYGDEAATVRVQWRHGVDDDELLVTNALGQGVARITRVAGETLLETADSRRFRAADVESLTEQVLGWRLPLAGLADWLRARATPDSQATIKLDDIGRFLQLEQDAWNIEYQEYSGTRPVRMRLTRPNLEFRLIVDEWHELGP
ncbi:MAG: lipoprotein insertase outer membrane protein LolB [Burkholderiales bacterium]